jgi:hypothetical protein
MSTPVIATPLSLAMARSPQFVTAKNNALALDTLTDMDLNLRIRTGVLDASGSFNYSLSKDYSINQVINFEISDLVRSEFYHDFSVWNDIGYTQSPQGEALWVIPTGSVTYSNNGAAPANATFPDESETAFAYLTTDGWATRDNIAPVSVTQAVLATSRNRQVLVGNYESLAINNSVNNGLAYIVISWQSGDSDDFFISAISTDPPSPASNNSQDLVIYAGVGPANLENNPFLPSEIKPSNQPNGGVGQYYDVILFNANDTPTEIGRVRYYVICEAKYTPVQVGFINRFGVADFITFFKRSDERGNFTQDSYQKSIYNDGFTTPSLEVGKYTSYNVNSRNTLSLNTGFVDQDYDETIEDILMSEYVAVYTNSNWVSVVPNRGSIEYQKSVNTQLINYTMSFDFGFDERSLVR